MEPSKIWVAVPTRGQVDFRTVKALQAIRDAASGLPPIHFEAGRLTVTSVRNWIVNDFLKRDEEYLLMVDDDTIPDPRILELADYGKDIIGASYPIVRPPKYLIPVPCALTFCDEHNTLEILKNPFGRTGLLKVDALGTGCMFIHRRVLEHPEMKPPFRFGVDDSGILTMTEDVWFCLEAKKRGFEVWVDFDRPADHLVQVSTLGITDGFAKAYALARQKEHEEQRIVHA